MPGPTEIVLVRHAERAGGGDPGLTSAGGERARRLASMVEKSGVTAIFTSAARRTRETAAPLASRLALVPVALSGTNPVSDAAVVLASPPGMSVVVGHSDTVPKLIRAFGIAGTPSIADTEFDRLFIVTLGAGGPRLTALRY